MVLRFDAYALALDGLVVFVDFAIELQGREIECMRIVVKKTRIIAFTSVCLCCSHHLRVEVFADDGLHLLYSTNKSDRLAHVHVALPASAQNSLDYHQNDRLQSSMTLREFERFADYEY